MRSPPRTRTRPTADRVREAVFDILGSLVDISGMRVADLYAGSGAMGIEALSRGAGRVEFVEEDRQAVRTIRENLAALGVKGAHAKVVRGDVLEWTTRSGPFDLAFMDPPYSFRRWPELLDRVEATWSVLETSVPPVVPSGWEVIKEKQYGSTLVTVLRCRRSIESPGFARHRTPDETRDETRDEKGKS